MRGGARAVRGDGFRPRERYAAPTSRGVRGVSGGLPERETDRSALSALGCAARPRFCKMVETDGVTRAEVAESTGEKLEPVPDDEDDMLRRIALLSPESDGGIGPLWG